MTKTKFNNLPVPTPGEPVMFEEPIYESDARIKELEDGVTAILKANTLVSAKEIAADLMNEDVDDYLIQSVDSIMDHGRGEDTQEELDFDADDEFKKTFNTWE